MQHNGAEERKKQNQEFVAKRLDNYMNDMLVDILIDKPADVLKFMAEWVSKKKLIEKNPGLAATPVKNSTSPDTRTPQYGRAPASNPPRDRDTYEFSSAGNANRGGDPRSTAQGALSRAAETSPTRPAEISQTKTIQVSSKPQAPEVAPAKPKQDTFIPTPAMPPAQKPPAPAQQVVNVQPVIQHPPLVIGGQKQPAPQAQPAANALTKPSPTGYSKPEVHSGSESDEEQAPAPKAPVQPQAAAAKKPLKVRAAVSAEVYGAYNKKENFKARVIKKSPEEQATIKEKLLKSFLFKALDEKDLQTCIDAMEIKRLK